MAPTKRRPARRRPARLASPRRPRATADAAAAAATRPLPRVAKGKRARFHADPNVDHLFAIVAALTAELSVVSERLLTLERVLIARGSLADTDIESHTIDEAEARLRLERREGLIERVFQVLETAN